MLLLASPADSDAELRTITVERARTRWDEITSRSVSQLSPKARSELPLFLYCQKAREPLDGLLLSGESRLVSSVNVCRFLTR